MKLSKIIEKIEEWMDYFTYGYIIKSIIPDARYKYKISFTELCPNGTSDFYSLYVDEDGNMYNSMDNLISFARDAYDNDKEIIEWIDKFEKKWRV